MPSFGLGTEIVGEDIIVESRGTFRIPWTSNVEIVPSADRKPKPSNSSYEAESTNVPFITRRSFYYKVIRCGCILPDKG
jgi:hypothetical protein